MTDPQYNWVLSEAVSDEQINKFPELSPITVQLLKNRGIESQEAVDQFLNPDYLQDQHDPYLFRDMEKAVARIDEALEKNEKIVIHGDYDADGVCGSSVLYITLKKLGGDVSVYLPHRDTEGYGLNMNTIDKLAAEKTDLIITVDCATSNLEEIASAAKQGMDVIVTDHHSQPPVLPKEAVAILNPKLEEETYPFEYLAGVGVAFKVAQALIKKYELGEAFEKWLLDLVAISTVTDFMSLVGENRVFVKYGLIVLQKNQRPGLRALFDTMAVDPKSSDTTTIGFKIGPHINAAGRINHANMAFELLVEDDVSEAARMAEDLGRTNKERQSLSQKMSRQAMKQAEEQKDEYIIIVQSEDWPVGLLGLVAGKVASHYQRPTYVLSTMGDEIVGSGRSIEQFHLVEALQSMDELFSKYGGHPQACGFSLKDEESLEPFIQRMRERARELLEGVDLRKTLDVEMETRLSQLDWDFIDVVKECEPYGQGNPEPIFVSRGVRVEDFKLVGKNQNHLKIDFFQDNTHRPAIGFGLGEYAEQLEVGKLVDIAYTVGVNEWNGNAEIQLMLKDIDVNS